MEATPQNISPGQLKMTKKNRTVKELNGDMELLLDKMKKLQDDSKDLQTLKKKVEKMEELLQINHEKIILIEDSNDNTSEKQITVPSCEICGENF